MRRSGDVRCVGVGVGVSLLLNFEEPSAQWLSKQKLITFFE
jgi:hypothetical protein